MYGVGVNVFFFSWFKFELSGIMLFKKCIYLFISLLIFCEPLVCNADPISLGRPEDFGLLSHHHKML